MVKKIIVFIVLIALSFVGGLSMRSPKVIIPDVLHPAPNVVTIQVPVPVLDTKTIQKIVKEYIPVEDQTMVINLTVQNKKLDIKIDELNHVIAKLKSEGTGTTVSMPTDPNPIKFDDTRLAFTIIEGNVKYSLNQTFTIVNTTGKNKKGVSTNLFAMHETFKDKVFEVSPDNIKVKTITTTPMPHWFVSPRLQFGMGYTQTKTALGFASSQTNPSGIVALQLIKKGKTYAPEDIRVAILSPAVNFSSKGTSYGALPVSFNIGSLPKQPFTNIWISPYVGTTTFSGIDKVGAFATVTF